MCSDLLELSVAGGLVHHPATDRTPRRFSHGKDYRPSFDRRCTVVGMYTEFFFRAQLRKDAPAKLIDWFDDLANNPEGEATPYDDHPFFKCERWESTLYGGGAVYQVSRALQFTRGTDRSYERPELIVHASLKNYGSEVESFVDWVIPFVDATPGDFLGYSLYEDSRPDGYYDKGPDQERPELLFMPDLKGAKS